MIENKVNFGIGGSLVVDANYIGNRSLLTQAYENCFTGAK